MQCFCADLRSRPCGSSEEHSSNHQDSQISLRISPRTAKPWVMAQIIHRTASPSWQLQKNPKLCSCVWSPLVSSPKNNQESHYLLFPSTAVSRWQRTTANYDMRGEFPKCLSSMVLGKQSLLSCLWPWLHEGDSRAIRWAWHAVVKT